MRRRRRAHPASLIAQVGRDAGRACDRGLAQRLGDDPALRDTGARRAPAALADPVDDEVPGRRGAKPTVNSTRAGRCGADTSLTSTNHASPGPPARRPAKRSDSSQPLNWLRRRWARSGPGRLEHDPAGALQQRALDRERQAPRRQERQACTGHSGEASVRSPSSTMRPPRPRPMTLMPAACRRRRATPGDLDGIGRNCAPSAGSTRRRARQRAGHRAERGARGLRASPARRGNTAIAFSPVMFRPAATRAPARRRSRPGRLEQQHGAALAAIAQRGQQQCRSGHPPVAVGGNAKEVDRPTPSSANRPLPCRRADQVVVRQDAHRRRHPRRPPRSPGSPAPC
jgi:hypothetical protein